jgi:hypothetical protein
MVSQSRKRVQEEQRNALRDARFNRKLTHINKMSLEDRNARIRANTAKFFSGAATFATGVFNSKLAANTKLELKKAF